MQPQKSGGTAAAIEVICGLVLQTFGIGQLYLGNVFFGLMMMFGWWVVAAINVALMFVVVGFFSYPICWVGMMLFAVFMAVARGGK